jgi:hypothetical protein
MPPVTRLRHAVLQPAGEGLEGGRQGTLEVLHRLDIAADQDDSGTEVVGHVAHRGHHVIGVLPPTVEGTALVAGLGLLAGKRCAR